MMLLRIFCRIECGTFNCKRGLQLPAIEQLPAYFYLITRLIQLDCFGKSVCSRKGFCLFELWFNVMMNNNCHEYDFSMEFLLLSCNKEFNFCSQDTHITFLL